MKQVLSQLSWPADGLIPAIVQDDQTKEVLMLAYMNEEALLKTIETKETWFYSRSHQALWNKGETSGHKQKVIQLSYDCDGDSLLILVEPQGPACHTGKTSCFYNPIITDNGGNRPVIEQLIKCIQERVEQPVEGSYTTYLLTEGIDKILKKVGEEASEIIIAAKNDDPDELIWEIADFIYHTLVLMQVKNITIHQIYRELAKRFGKRSEEHS